MSGIAHLSATSIEYQKLADDYRQIAVDAAEAEAAHKSLRARVGVAVQGLG